MKFTKTNVDGADIYTYEGYPHTKKNNVEHMKYDYEQANHAQLEL